ncbi:MAG: ABC transporter permease [Chloroflexota bacterium]|nr:ABC transporter permease [Chloroflexota bacterium]
MLKFLVGRVIQGIIVLFGASILIFAMVRSTGNPVALLLPPEATAEQMAAMTHALGLDKPLYDQYAIFVGRAAHGDFGTSLQLQQPVLQLLGQRLPNSLKLAGLALFFGLLIGVPLGVLAAQHRGGWVDQAASGIATIGQSIPSFWLAILLVAILSGELHLLPAARATGPANYVLPVLALTLTGFLLSGTIRFVRSGMLDVMNLDYVKVARAKGLSERTVIWRHALRNALIPLVSFLGFYVTLLVGGVSLAVELVFAWPGLGPLLYDSVLARDFPVVQAVVIVYVTGFVVMSIVVDLLYAVLDPTVSLR